MVLKKGEGGGTVWYPGGGVGGGGSGGGEGGGGTVLAVADVTKVDVSAFAVPAIGASELASPTFTEAPATTA